MTTDTAISVLSPSPLSGPSFGARTTGLTQSERAVYRGILEQFIAGGRPPRQSLPANEVARLIDADLIQVDDGDRITVAYPFSAQQTRHRVALHDGRSYYAVCAIDALGIPYMPEERGQLEAREPDGQRIVRVTVDPVSEPRWTPARAVAVAASGDGCCLAQSACPHINLFASPDAARRYLVAHGLVGTMLSISEAATSGRRLFGELRQGLAGTEAR
jgi:hypothetical protein